MAMVKHTGGCHCGRVRFEVLAPAEIEVMDCNCSICSKLGGFLHLIVRESLATYTFNTGVAQHTFCSRCGIKSFYVPRSHPQAYSVSARCLDPGTVTSTRVTRFDGANWEEAAAKLEAS
jgi:hypothetical protein